MAVRSTPKTPAAVPPAGASGQPDTAPALVPHGAHAGKPALPLHRPLILIGARQRAHVHLISNSVSRVHAVIINTDHGSYIRDLASRTGTIVNGRQVKEAGLRHSDTIAVGAFQFKFSDPHARGPLAAAMRPPAAVLHIQGRGGPMAIEGRTVLVGQRDTCDVALSNPLVSTAHAIVFELNGRHFIRDLGSRTGTFVNGQQVHQEALEVGDMIRIGTTAIRYAAASADSVDLSEGEEGETIDAADTPVAAPGAAAAAVAAAAAGPVAAGGLDEFDNLDFAADVAEPAPAAAASRSEPAPAEAARAEVDPLEVAEPWQPPAAPAAPPPPAPAPTTATTHAGFDADAIPLAGEDAAPIPLDQPDESPRDEVASATTDDIFGIAEPSDAPAPAPPAAEPRDELPDEPLIPLDDPEPAVAEAESLAPLPAEPFDAGSVDAGSDLGSDAGPAFSATTSEASHLPPPLPTAAGDALDPDIDFPAEPESLGDTLNNPFGPLTDLNLNLLDESESLPPLAPPRPLLDEIDLGPAVGESPAPVVTPPEPPGRSQAAFELSPPGSFDLPPLDVAPPDEPAPLDTLRPFDEPAPAERESAEPSPAPSGDTRRDPFGFTPGPFDLAAETEASVEPPAPTQAEPVATFGQEIPDAGFEDLAAEGPVGSDAAVNDMPPLEPRYDGPAPRVESAEEPPAADPVASDTTADIDAEVRMPTAGEPAAPADSSFTTDVRPVELEPVDVAPEATEAVAPPAESAATIPADVDAGAADFAPAPEAPPAEVPALELPAPELAPPETPALESPAAEPPAPHPVEAADAAAVAPVVEPPASKKRVRKPPVRKKATPAAAAAPPPPPVEAAPKKRKPWGKKAKDASAASAAADEQVTPPPPPVEVPAEPFRGAEAETPAIAAQAEEPIAPVLPPAAGESLWAGSSIAPAEALVAPTEGSIATAEDLLGPTGDHSALGVETPAASEGETLARTEPSPESALALEMPGADAASPSATQSPAADVSFTSSEHPPEMPPSDPAFDAMIEEFVGPSTGPIVEQSESSATASELELAGLEVMPPEPAAEAPPAEAPSAEAPRAEPPVESPSELPGEPSTSLITPPGGFEVPDAIPDPYPLDVEPAHGLTGGNASATATATDDAFGQAAPAPAVEEPPADLPAISELPPAADVAPAPETGESPSETVPVPTPPTPPPARESRPAFDPFMGMGRDLGSFIGGLPLDLSEPDPFAMGGLPPPPPPLPPVVPPLAIPPAPATAGATPRAPQEPSALPPLVAPADAPDALDIGPPEEPSFDLLAPPGGGSSGATLGEADLDLTFPDLTAPELPERNQPATGATAPEGLLDQAALDLPPLEAPVEEPPVAPAGKAGDEEIDPLLFTEAEAPTIQLLPTPPVEPLTPPAAGRGPGQRDGPRGPRTPPPGRTPGIQPPPPARGPNRPGQANYPPTPPPPARSGGRPGATKRPVQRTPFDLDAPDLGAALGIPAIGTPPAKPGTAAHAFDGLALPPVREADVFGGLPLGTDDPILGGRPGARRAPDQRNRGGRAEAAPLPGPTGPLAELAALAPQQADPLSPLAPLAPLAPPRRGNRAPNRRPQGAGAPPADLEIPSAHAAGGDVGPAPFPYPGAAPQRRRSVGLGVWLVLMFVTLGATAAGIYFFGPRPGAEVVGTLQFERLRDMGEGQRLEFEKEQRAWMGDPRFRAQAREILMVNHGARMPPGFLGDDLAAMTAYDQIVEKAHVKERTGSLTLPYRGTDPRGDRARMEALVKALHAQNKPRGDLAAVLQGQYEKAQKELAALSEKMEKARETANELRERAEAAADLEKKFETAAAEDAKLRAAAAEARREVERLSGELERAQRGAPAGGAAPAGDAAPAELPAPQVPPGLSVSLISLVQATTGAAPPAGPAASAAPSPAGADAQIREWSQELERIKRDLADADAKQAALAESAAKSFDEALARFADALKRAMAEKADPTVRAAWAADAQLRRAEQDLALKQRHRNAALGGGLPKEAERLDSEIGQLAKQIDARRTALAAGGSYAAGVTELEALLADSRSRGGAERARADERLMERLGELAAAVNAASGNAAADVPEEPGDVVVAPVTAADAGELGQRARELKAARQAFVAAVTPGAESPAGDVAAADPARRAAELQRRIASRRVTLAAAAAQDAQAAQEARAQSAEKIRAALDEAVKREAAASAAADRGAAALRDAKAALAEAKQAAAGVEEAMRQLLTLETQHKQQFKRAEEAKAELAQAVVPIEPGADAVVVSPTGEDRRLLYILFAGAAIVAGFSVMMWMSSHGGDAIAIPDRDNPFEAPIVGADPAAPPADPDDERPLAV